MTDEIDWIVNGQMRLAASLAMGRLSFADRLWIAIYAIFWPADLLAQCVSESALIAARLAAMGEG